MAVEIVVGYTARHARRARCASRARTRMSSPCVARVIAVFCPPVHDRHARSAVAAALARSRAHGAALALAVEVAVGYTAPHERHVRHSYARTRTHMSSPFPPPPRTTGTRALRWRRRSLDREHAVTAAAAAAAAAATDDTRDDGRGDDPPPRALLRHGRLSAPPPPQKHHRVAPSSSHFCPLSRPLSRRTRGRVSGTPIIRPSVRMTAHCAHTAHNTPPPPRARASERNRDRPAAT